MGTPVRFWTDPLVIKLIMDKKTLEKLSKNPFYKMNAEQLTELENATRKPMVTFGVPSIEKNKFAKHETNVVKIKYENKKGNK